MLKKSIVLHPILFAIFPTLSLYANNSDQFSYTVIIVPITISVFPAFLASLTVMAEIRRFMVYSLLF